MTLELISYALSALGPGGIACALVILGRLSARMHETTRGAPVYRWFYFAALLAGASAVARLIGPFETTAVEHSWEWVVLYDGLPTLAVLIGLVAAWHTWAWLLAERD